MSSIAGNQARTFLQLFAELSPYFRIDRGLSTRIQQRLARERRFGSRDRRLYRELLYTAVRYLPWLEERGLTSEDAILQTVAWLASATPATEPIKAAYAVELGPVPFSVLAKASVLGVSRELLPAWTAEQCPRAALPPDLDVLHARAPLWLRLQTSAPASVFDEFRNRGWTWETSTVLPNAVEVSGERDVTSTDSFQHGRFEVQDLGSQLLLPAAGVSPGTRWLDACAGAGGKSLQLARLLGPEGSVVAHDIRPAALDELMERARRGAVTNIAVAKQVSGRFDGVLVDAPCTGSGTWRRSPHLKWCTSSEEIRAAAALQKNLLTQFAAHVAPGGRLVYATCSLCRDENEAVVKAFLAESPGFSPAPFSHDFGAERRDFGLMIWPALHNTDGFFVCALERR